MWRGDVDGINVVIAQKGIDVIIYVVNMVSLGKGFCFVKITTVDRNEVGVIA
jgi:hypothetical protein